MIIYATDFHGNQELFEKLFRVDCDAIIYGGDLCPRKLGDLLNSAHVQEEFLKWLIPRVNKPFYCIMGNDDLRVNQSLLEEAENCTPLKIINKKKIQYNDFLLVGYSYVPVTPFKLKDWEKYEDHTHSIPDGAIDIAAGFKTVQVEENIDNIEDDLASIKTGKPDRTIYVMHSPPSGTKLDMIGSGHHVGSSSIRSFIESEQPFLTLHGHIHESPRISGKYMDRIGHTLCINPGSDFHIYNNPGSAKITVIDLKSLKISIEDLNVLIKSRKSF